MHRVPGLPAGAYRAAIELETDIESDGTNRRLDAQAGAHAAAQLGEIDVTRAFEHVAAVDEDDAADRPHERRAKLRVQDDFAVAAPWKALGRDCRGNADRVEREAADRRVASGEEPLARGQVANRDNDGIALDVERGREPRKSAGEAQP